jgi:hypothetical protein
MSKYQINVDQVCKTKQEADELYDKIWNGLPEELRVHMERVEPPKPRTLTVTKDTKAQDITDFCNSLPKVDGYTMLNLSFTEGKK